MQYTAIHKADPLKQSEHKIISVANSLGTVKISDVIFNGWALIKAVYFSPCARS